MNFRCSVFLLRLMHMEQQRPLWLYFASVVYWNLVRFLWLIDRCLVFVAFFRSEVKISIRAYFLLPNLSHSLFIEKLRRIWNYTHMWQCMARNTTTFLVFSHYYETVLQMIIIRFSKKLQWIPSEIVIAARIKITWIFFGKDLLLFWLKVVIKWL